MKERLRKLEALTLTVAMCASMMQTGVMAAEFGDGENVAVEQQGVFSDSSEAVFSDADIFADDEKTASTIMSDEEQSDNNNENSNNNDLSDEAPMAEDPEATVSSAAIENLVRSVDRNGKVDVAFLIDSTGSMGDEIAGVRSNLSKFTEVLQNAGLDFRISVIDYKDIVEDGLDSTKILTSDGERWFTTSEKVSSVLDTIRVNGGGDDPETVLDAIGLMNTLDFRDDASKFAILLTDAGYKTNNQYGYSDMAAAVAALKDKGVSMSVITANSLQSTYSDLSEGTDGIFANIYGNFAEELVKLASYVENVVNPVTFKLSTKVENHPLTSGYMTATLTAEISASDKKKTAKNISVQLEIPEGIILDKGVQQTQIIESLAPGETKTLTWSVFFPVPSDDTNYEWKVKADCDDFATGVVCQAQDKFSVAGKEETSYKYEFGKDNYCFLNSDTAFGSGSYYIAPNDLKAYLDQLENTEIQQTAKWFAQDSSIENLRKGNLKEWTGSCYGMSLSAALFKTGILNTSSYGAETTYRLPELRADSNSELESLINMYHISQASDVAMSWESDLSKMIDMAENIGKPGKRQMPYMIRMDGIDGAHTVLCYGIEYGNYVGSYDYADYAKRLLIADPNSKKEEYIYISKNNEKAYFSNGSFDTFSYYKANLAELNSYDYEDTVKNYSAKWYAQNMTDYIIENSKGKKAVIIANKIVSSDGLDVKSYLPVDGSSSSDEIPIMILQKNEDSNSSDFTITPANGDNIDATFYIDDYALSVKADASSAEFGKDGSIELNQAKGEVSLGVTLNNSTFDFVTVSGEADGTVNISKEGDSLIVKGDLEDFEIENQDRAGNTTDFNVEGNKNVKVELGEDKKELDVKYDPKGEENYDTPLENVTHAHDYDVKFVWSGDQCTAQITCKKDSCEFKDVIPCSVSYETVSGSTCTSEGQGKQIAKVTYDGKAYSDIRWYSIPAKGHEWEEEYRVDKEASCGETGSKSIHCKNCTEIKGEEVIPATGEHEYGEIEIIKEATAVKTGEGQKICSICGNIDKVVIDKLPATAKLNMKTVTLKVKQSTKALKVTGLAKGDSIKSYTSNNKKVAVVDKNGKITAKSVGNAKITIKLASGKKVSVTVKVQKTTVKTTSLTIKDKKVVLKKGQTYTLKPVIKPLTSQQKATYQSSDSKVISVSSKGKITAKKKGTAIVTIKSGAKVTKVKVTVK